MIKTANPAFSAFIVVLVWIALYVLTLYCVQLALVYGDSKNWAIPAWVLLYLIPGFIAGYLLATKWIIAGLLIGVIGCTIWIVHSQTPMTVLGTAITIGIYSIISLIGSWLGQKENLRRKNAL